jgi:hypothetical protein
LFWRQPRLLLDCCRGSFQSVKRSER